MQKSKPIYLTQLPVLITALVLGFLEGFTVPIVEALPSFITVSSLSIILALFAGIGGGLILLLCINLFLSLTRSITFKNQTIRSIGITCLLVYMTVFLIISFTLQDFLLPLFTSSVIDHLIVSAVTAFTVLLIWFLYHNVPLKCKFNTNKQAIILQETGVPLLGSFVFVYEFLFLTFFSLVLSLPLPTKLALVFGPFSCGFAAGLMTVVLWNTILKTSQQTIRLTFVSRRKNKPMTTGYED